MDVLCWFQHIWTTSTSNAYFNIACSMTCRLQHETQHITSKLQHNYHERLYTDFNMYFVCQSELNMTYAQTSRLAQRRYDRKYQRAAGRTTLIHSILLTWQALCLRQETSPTQTDNIYRITTSSAETGIQFVPIQVCKIARGGQVSKIVRGGLEIV